MGRVSVVNGGIDPHLPAGVRLAKPPLSAPPTASATRSMVSAGPDQPRLSDLLGMDNPARLSRAEFRVCLMLSRNLPLEAAARELQLSQATVRSHLHKIYAKTGCATLAELVQRLQPISLGQGE